MKFLEHAREVKQVVVAALLSDFTNTQDYLPEENLRDVLPDDWRV